MEVTKSQRNMLKEVITHTESVVVIAEETAAGSEQVAASSHEMDSGMNSYRDNFSRLVSVAGDLLSDAQRFKLKEAKDQIGEAEEI